MKKISLSIAIFPLLLIVLFVSCQKETSFENPVKVGGTAKFTVAEGTGSCTGVNVSGSFTAGTAVTSANTVTVSVDVDSIGSYIISTSSVNGVSFSGSGVFTTEGVQTITLTASGTPNAAGVFNFTPVPNGCTYTVTVAANNGGTTGAAQYSFNGGTSACTGAAVNGTFTAGKATASTNAVVLKVQVDKVGTYTISTNTVNGIKFTGTGSFTATGAQTVTLSASGTPTTSGNFSFTPGSNACNFNVSVGAGGTPGGGGSGNFLKCKINGVLTNFNAALRGYYVARPTAGIPYSVSIQGKNSDVANSVQELWVTVANPTAPTTGAYSNQTFSMDMTDRACQVGFYPTGFPNPYWSSSHFNANTLTVNITSVSTAGATGTFQGTIYESNGGGPATKNVTEGEFKITF